MICLSFQKSARWGATCTYSRTNRQLSTSPIPLAPHLARDWCPWLASDSESDGEMESVHTLDKYHKKIHLVRRPVLANMILKILTVSIFLTFASEGS